MREQRVELKLYGKEKDVFRTCAEKSGENLSQWMRRCLREAAKDEMGLDVFDESRVPPAPTLSSPRKATYCKCGEEAKCLWVGEALCMSCYKKEVGANAD
jgi:hypothetical protein